MSRSQISINYFQIIPQFSVFSFDSKSSENLFKVFYHFLKTRSKIIELFSNKFLQNVVTNALHVPYCVWIVFVVTLFWAERKTHPKIIMHYLSILTLICIKLDKISIKSQYGKLIDCLGFGQLDCYVYSKFPKIHVRVGVRFPIKLLNDSDVR